MHSFAPENPMKRAVVITTLWSSRERQMHASMIVICDFIIPAGPWPKF